MSPSIKAHVLIVDDEPASVRLLARALQGEYEILVATSGAEALMRARIKTQLQFKRLRDQLADEVAAKTEKINQALMELRQVYSQIRTGYIEAIHRLTLAAEYKDEETREHIKRVGFYTEEIAVALGMDDAYQDAIFHAAPMHDLGKVGIPDSILLKPGKLTDAEWEILKRHTLIGGKILEGSDSPYLADGP